MLLTLPSLPARHCRALGSWDGSSARPGEKRDRKAWVESALPPARGRAAPAPLLTVTFSAAFASLCSFLAFLSAVSALPSSVNPGLWLLLPQSLPGCGWGPPAGPTRGAGGTPKQQKSGGWWRMRGWAEPAAPGCGSAFGIISLTNQGRAWQERRSSRQWFGCSAAEICQGNIPGKASRAPWEADHPESPENAGILEFHPFGALQAFPGEFLAHLTCWAHSLLAHRVFHGAIPDLLPIPALVAAAAFPWPFPAGTSQE